MTDKTTKQKINLDPEDLLDKDVFELMGLKDVSKEQKDKMMHEMTRTIQNRILARILDLLDEKSTKEFEKVIDQHDDKATQKFLNSKKIDLVQISSMEALKYKVEMLDLINETGK